MNNDDRRSNYVKQNGGMRLTLAQEKRLKKRERKAAAVKPERKKRERGELIVAAPPDRGRAKFRERPWIRELFGKDADRLTTQRGSIIPAAERRADDECVYIPGMLPDGKKLNVCYKCGLPYSGSQRVCDRRVETKRRKDAEAAAAAAEAELSEMEKGEDE